METSQPHPVTDHRKKWSPHLHLDNVAALQQARQPISKAELAALGQQVMQGLVLNASLTNVRLGRAAFVGVFLSAALLLAAAILIEDVIRPRTDLSGMACEDQAGGGRVCYMWMTPPPGQPVKH